MRILIAFLGLALACPSAAWSQARVTLDEFDGGAPAADTSGGAATDEMLACLKRPQDCRSGEFRSGAGISMDDVVNLGIIDRREINRAKATSQRADGTLPSIDVEILFEYNSDEILPQQLGKVARLKELISRPEFADTKIALIGHTDASGSPSYNLSLSRRRAASVARTLAGLSDSLANRLLSTGMGESQLKTPNAPYAAENRRVQVVLVPVSR